ncbi:MULTISPECIES: DUF302 domain-containing protein [unclassified Helicobacter]|uniref:DUF302 domain-containing protein n=1 Tax=unclassified Helicobacter TaxID=2593540 RepID=UPI000CF198F5|nr:MULTISPECIES: DUF302 domain-containing protein [unclassified Helicobacter]
MKKFLFFFGSLLFLFARNQEPYLITKESKGDFNAVLERAIRVLDSNPNIKIFTIIDHAKAAIERDKVMQPSVVIVFGNPTVGTDFMNKYPKFAIQLPLKMLISQEKDKVFVSCINPIWMAQDQKIPIDEDFIQNTKKFLKSLIQEITLEQ